jgi:hypothetical protein
MSVPGRLLIVLCAALVLSAARVDAQETGDSAALRAEPQEAQPAQEAGSATGSIVTDGPRPNVRAVRVQEPISIDGRLDEPVWQRVEIGIAATGFVQRQPRPGEPASERTEVRLAFDNDNLYVAIRAYDSDPAAIISQEMRRDGSGGGGGFGSLAGAYNNDDSVALIFDSFLDRRNAFYFETNPNGARADALIENEGRPGFDWDGVWNAAGRRDDQGWTAELVIPFTTLRFDPATDAWGLQIRRLIRRKNEEVFWAPLGIDAQGERVSRAGLLAGMGGLQRGINLRIKPFGVASSTRDYDEPDRPQGENADVGIDLLRWGVTDSMTLDVTVNTDFAQVEVDDQQVNLTRFSLFFPEKREFFLENAGIFEYGTPGQGGGFRPPLYKAFFSRRIGLAEDEVVPIVAGTRFTGRAGGWNFGVMDVQTEAVDPFDPEADPIRETNWGVARVKRNLGARSTIGGIFTNKQSGSDDWNRVFGVDADINPSQRLNFTGFFTRSDDADAPAGWAAGAGFAWRGSIWRANAEYQEITDSFNPEMGFLLREDVRRFSSSVDFEPRPAANQVIRNFTFNLRSEVVYRRDGELSTVDTSLRFFGIDFQSGERLTLFGGVNFEQLFEPFEITDDITIDVGEYWFNEIGIFLSTNGARLASGRVFWTYGDFYDGTRLMGSTRFTLRPSKNFSFDTDWSFNDVKLPAGDFTANVVRQRVNFAFSPNLFWNTFLQYNSADELISVNSRFNWIYRPGADVFLVYNQSWDTGNATRPADQAVIFKFTYLFTL